MKTAFETYFNSLRGKRIAVLGLGVSNRPLVRLLLEFGCDVLGCDRTPREKLDPEVLQLEELGCKLSVGDNYLDGPPSSPPQHHLHRCTSQQDQSRSVVLCDVPPTPRGV